MSGETDLQNAVMGWYSEDKSALIDDDGDVRITNGDDTLYFTPREWHSLVEATRSMWDLPPWRPDLSTSLSVNLKEGFCFGQYGKPWWKFW